MGKLEIPKPDEEINKKTDDCKKRLRIIDLNGLSYTELIISIGVRSSSGKVAFSRVKGCKSKDYADGNIDIAWDRLKKKFEPTLTPSLVKQRICLGRVF